MKVNLGENYSNGQRWHYNGLRLGFQLDGKDMCVQCGKWRHSRCVGVKMVTPKFSTNFTCRKCEGNIGEAVEQEEKLCDEVETKGVHICW